MNQRSQVLLVKLQVRGGAPTRLRKTGRPIVPRVKNRFLDRSNIQIFVKLPTLGSERATPTSVGTIINRGA